MVSLSLDEESYRQNLGKPSNSPVQLSKHICIKEPSAPIKFPTIKESMCSLTKTLFSLVSVSFFLLHSIMSTSCPIVLFLSLMTEMS
ncbi:ORF101 [White spot syndrome virus]|uniref:Wsv027 n=3 Tax=White spot syndrome virus TaxID=342409 RepID=Q8VBD8_WSSVS|nr:wsv027 [Shrimp white spot syndrome virus]AFX59404.1 wsv027 [White spot syndrome virus]AAL33031.1 wsv027 [Shrimp white spot syndrome virus]AAL88951.1 WSSV083 [Shrimp white spot syndrome virus]ATU83760.1 ORF101 [White spot syndrome virus]AWQ60217.1 wsv027 [Shrimp white spot syndrome virus]